MPPKPPPSINLTKRQYSVLQTLYEKGILSKVVNVKLSQEQLAKDLNISRQALSNHLRILRDLDMIRTGRRFIDITERGITTLGETHKNAFVLIKVSPKHRMEVYNKISKIAKICLYRVTGDIDLIITVNSNHLEHFLRLISKIEGVNKTSAHIVLETRES